MSNVAVIDYGMGNLHSVCKALEFVGAAPTVIREPVEPDSFEHVVLPGVGALGDCMRGLKERKLDQWVKSWIAEDRPFLGVCLGLQALFEYSEEYDTQGLGVFGGNVVRFDLPHEFKIPHMGWNAVSFCETGTAMDEGISNTNNQFYFDHTFFVKPQNPDVIWGRTEHGVAFTSAIRRGNCFAAQFHPEKSQAIGLQIYKNFMKV